MKKKQSLRELAKEWVRILKNSQYSVLREDDSADGFHYECPSCSVHDGEEHDSHCEIGNALKHAKDAGF